MIRKEKPLRLLNEEKDIEKRMSQLSIDLSIGILVETIREYITVGCLVKKGKIADDILKIQEIRCSCGH